MKKDNAEINEETVNSSTTQENYNSGPAM